MHDNPVLSTIVNMRDGLDHSVNSISAAETSASGPNAMLTRRANSNLSLSRVGGADFRSDRDVTGSTRASWTPVPIHAVDKPLALYTGLAHDAAEVCGGARGDAALSARCAALEDRVMQLTALVESMAAARAPFCAAATADNCSHVWN